MLVLFCKVAAIEGTTSLFLRVCPCDSCFGIWPPPGRHVEKTRIERMHMQLPVRGRCIAFGGMAHSVDVSVHLSGHQRFRKILGCLPKVRCTRGM